MNKEIAYLVGHLEAGRLRYFELREAKVPIGSGVVATAIKKGEVEADVVAEAVEVMATLNAAPAEVMTAAGVVAATDVTGFT